METDPADPERSSRTLLTARDLSLLSFAAQQRLILASHAQSLLGVSPGVAKRRIRALAAGGYLTAHRVFAGQPACYQITRAGLGAVGSELTPPRLDVRGYAHDLGMAWLWLAARRGAFGPLSEILAERTLRSEDARAAVATRAGAPPHRGGFESGPYGVRLGGFRADGRERLHYPDLLLITPDGQRIAVELELTSKGQARREGILSGYGSDARVSTVLYLVDRSAVGRAVQGTARRLGIESLIQVQRIHQSLAPLGSSAGPVSERTASASQGRSDSQGAQR